MWKSLEQEIRIFSQDKSKTDLDQKYRLQLELETNENPSSTVVENVLPQIEDKKQRAKKKVNFAI